MIRQQIQLTEEQREKAERLASERGTSIAEVFRQLLDAAPDTDDRAERFARAIAAIKQADGRDVEGKTDVSVRHDEYLADIYEQDLRKR